MEAKVRKSPKRLLIDIPEEVHTTIKQKVAERNTTIRRWVLQAIKMRLDKEQI